MTTNNYSPTTSLVPYHRSRADRRADARIWSIEKTVHDLAAIGVFDFFVGPGPDPTQLPDYASNKVWLKQSPGVQTTPGTVRVWNGTSPASDEANWITVTPDTVPLSAATQAAAAEVSATLTAFTISDYEYVAANSTNVVLGTAGAIGDCLVGLQVVPASVSPGAVSIKDGADAPIVVFPGGASSLTVLVPFAIPLGIPSVSGAWTVTTGADVSVIAVGRFT